VCFCVFRRVGTLRLCLGSICALILFFLMFLVVFGRQFYFVAGAVGLRRRCLRCMAASLLSWHYSCCGGLLLQGLALGLLWRCGTGLLGRLKMGFQLSSAHGFRQSSTNILADLIKSFQTTAADNLAASTFAFAFAIC